MHWFRIIGLLLLTALLQVAVLPAVEIGGVRPDLLLLVALYLVAREPPRHGARWDAFWTGWSAGLLCDIYSAGAALPLGTTALVFGVVALLMSRAGAELFLGSVIAQALVFGPFVLVAEAALAIIRISAAGAPAGVALAGAWWTACYSAAAAPVVFAAIRPFERSLGIRSLRSFGRA